MKHCCIVERLTYSTLSHCSLSIAESGTEQLIVYKCAKMLPVTDDASSVHEDGRDRFLSTGSFIGGVTVRCKDNRISVDQCKEVYVVAYFWMKIEESWHVGVHIHWTGSCRIVLAGSVEAKRKVVETGQQMYVALTCI